MLRTYRRAAGRKRQAESEKNLEKYGHGRFKSQENRAQEAPKSCPEHSRTQEKRPKAPTRAARREKNTQEAPQTPPRAKKGANMAPTSKILACLVRYGTLPYSSLMQAKNAMMSNTPGAASSAADLERPTSSQNAPKSGPKTLQSFPSPSQMEPKTLPNQIFEQFLRLFFSGRKFASFFCSFVAEFVCFCKSRPLKFMRPRSVSLTSTRFGMFRKKYQKSSKNLPETCPKSRKNQRKIEKK